MEIGYLTVSQVRLGAKIGDARAKDSNAFCKRLILYFTGGAERHKIKYKYKDEI